MGCVLFPHARLREIFEGNDRERMEYVGGDKTIRNVDAPNNNLNKVFPVMAKAWKLKLPAINMCAISVAPRGEDRPVFCLNGQPIELGQCRNIAQLLACEPHQEVGLVK